MKYLTKENITFAIAVLSFTLSLWNFSKDIWNNRSKISLQCKSCTTGKIGSRNIIYFQFSIENKSRLSISISRMFFVVNDIQYEFNWIPELIFKGTHTTAQKVTDEEHIYSEKIPHTIDGLGVWGGFFSIITPCILSNQELLNSNTYILFFTNRGVKKTPLTLHDELINPNKNTF